MWTFGRKIAAGFALAFVLLVAVGVVSYRCIAALTQTPAIWSRTPTWCWST